MKKILPFGEIVKGNARHTGDREPVERAVCWHPGVASVARESSCTSIRNCVIFDWKISFVGDRRYTPRGNHTIGNESWKNRGTTGGF
jgi:hypothetical protein